MWNYLVTVGQVGGVVVENVTVCAKLIAGRDVILARDVR